MKLLFDENLSPSLVALLADIFPGSIHVHEAGLGSSDDDAVWNYARVGGYAVVSKDSDYRDRGVLSGHPPKIIWLRIGNCTTSKVERLIRGNLKLLASFGDDEMRCWSCGRHSG